MQLYLCHILVLQFSLGSIFVAILHIRRLRLRLGGLSKIILKEGGGLHLTHTVQLAHRLHGKTEASNQSPASSVTQCLFESTTQTTKE